MEQSLLAYDRTPDINGGDSLCGLSQMLADIETVNLKDAYNIIYISETYFLPGAWIV